MSSYYDFKEVIGVEWVSVEQFRMRRTARGAAFFSTLCDNFRYVITGAYAASALSAKSVSVRMEPVDGLDLVLAKQEQLPRFLGLRDMLSECSGPYGRMPRAKVFRPLKLHR